MWCACGRVIGMGIQLAMTMSQMNHGTPTEATTTVRARPGGVEGAGSPYPIVVMSVATKSTEPCNDHFCAAGQQEQRPPSSHTHHPTKYDIREFISEYNNVYGTKS